MNKDSRLFKIITSKYWRRRYFLHLWIFRLMPSETWLKYKYKLEMGKILNLDNPQTFNEKLQWLKLHDHNPLYTTLVDKYAVKEYIKEKLGEEYVIPLVGGPWRNAKEIDFDTLPDQFVLKCTHDSGGIVICRDKSNFDIKGAQKKLNKCLKRNFYYGGREWPYKDVKPQIIAEKYMGDKVTDYKFYCFNGKVKCLYVSTGLENHQTARISFLTPEWKFAPFDRSDYIPYEKLPNKPVNYDKMLKIAGYLSRGNSFLRVDLFELRGKIYFSELTLYPCSGYMPFVPEEWDMKLGNELSLPL